MSYPVRTSIMQPMGRQHFMKMREVPTGGHNEKWSGSWTDGTRPRYIVRLSSKGTF